MRNSFVICWGDSFWGFDPGLGTGQIGSYHCYSSSCPFEISSKQLRQVLNLRSSCLHPTCWDYRHAPSCLAITDLSVAVCAGKEPVQKFSLKTVVVF